MTVVIDGTSGINTPGVVNTAAETIATTLAVTGVTTFAAGTAALPAITTTGDTNTGIFFPAADTIAFAEGGVEAVRIDSSGNVGIGTSSPTASSSNKTFTINAPATFTSLIDLKTNETLNLRVFSGVSNSGLSVKTATPLLFDTNDIERMRIESGGNINLNSVVYANTTVNAANMFLNSGPTHQIYRSTSSIRYKTNVETIEDSYSTALLQCRPVWFRSLCGGDNREHGYWGFIAEEVAAIDPRLVFWTTTETTQNENGESTTVDLETPIVEGVQYDRFVPHLLNLIKKQNETITALTTRITALENNNATQ